MKKKRNVQPVYTIERYQTKSDRFYVAKNGTVCATFVVEPGCIVLRVASGIKLVIEVTTLDPERKHWIIDKALLQLCIDKYNELNNVENRFL